MTSRPTTDRTHGTAPRRTRRAGLRVSVFAALLLAAGPAAAGPAIDAVTGRNAPFCFARLYDHAHLARHPRQEVEEIWLGRTATALADPAPAGVEVLDFGFVLGGQTYSALATCRGTACSLEGDAGSFTLRRDGASLLLAVGDHLVLEGATDFSPDLARSADDRLFRLDPAEVGRCG